MAVDANTFQTYDAKGLREDLTDEIYMISPTDVSFTSSIPRVKAYSTLHEWQTDELAAAAANKQLEGDDAATDPATATVRPGNRTQILTKVPSVSGTQEEAAKAGRSSELEYQVFKKAQELTRDLELAALGEQIPVAGAADVTAREMGGVINWILTNRRNNGTGTYTAPTHSAGTPTVAGSLTAGTPAAFSELNFNLLLSDIWEQGGNPDTVFLGGVAKFRFSTFKGRATREISAEDRKLVVTVDIYQSDYGVLEVIPNRFMSQNAGENHVLVLQRDMWALAFFRPYRISDLAKTGDSEKRLLLTEVTLESRQQKASGILLGVDETAAAVALT